MISSVRFSDFNKFIRAFERNQTPLKDNYGIPARRQYPNFREDLDYSFTFVKIWWRQKYQNFKSHG